MRRSSDWTATEGRCTAVGPQPGTPRFFRNGNRRGRRLRSRGDAMAIEKASKSWSSDTPVREDYRGFGSPQILQPEIDDVTAALRSGWIGTGPRTGAFEQKFREYIGARHALAVHSCTAGLHLAFLAIGLRPGDEVIVPSMTFAASANAVIHAGGKPVLADVNRSTMCLDPEDASRRITPRTR